MYRQAAADDTTSRGETRQRKRPLTQADRERASQALGLATTCSFTTTLNRTVYHWWNEYAHGTDDRPAFRDLEIATSGAWRLDIPGATQGVNKAAWCQRKNIYELIEWYMSTDFKVVITSETYELRPLREDEALLEADKTYQCCIDEKGRQNFRQRIVPQFKRQRVYERCSEGRLVDPMDGHRFYPEAITTLVSIYTSRYYWVGNTAADTTTRVWRRLTDKEAWEEADKTTTSCLTDCVAGKSSLILEFEQQKCHEDLNMGWNVNLKELARFGN
jgi:hypothetical protein